ncbi:glycosyltransferase [Trichoderma arundinaceum]|uniref:Glycosyltransferase n=1 Tax=Trichoderma arundinaceum TaxID=490622 RepID=A0A395N7C9_TRIAR|nr:glycosyltransferase [Trichoderma arundinaceum]
MAPSNIEAASDKADNVPAGLKLIPKERLDPRSDAEIALVFQQKQPITSDKNIWAFWHSGYNHMPAWLRRNAIDWVRRQGPGWTVHVLDDVPGSPTNVRNYLEPELLSEAFIKGTMDGIYKGTHSGDLVRLALLWKYGGVWIDIGAILLRSIEDICWREIEDPNTPYEIGTFLMMGFMTNGFIACKKGNSFIKRWHDEYLKLWQGGVTNATGFHKDPKFKGKALFDSPHKNITLGEIVDYSAHLICLFVLQELVEEDWNGPEYYLNHIYFTNGDQEMFLFHSFFNWDATKEFELLSRKRSGEGVIRDEQWEEAEDIINKTLAGSSLIKLSHGPKNFWETTLAGYWDAEENAEAHNAPGTFAAYLREGSVKYEQTRELVSMRMQSVGTDIKKESLSVFQKD